MGEMNRREFVAVATVAAACACTVCGDLDNSAAAAPEKKLPQKVDVGTLADYPADGITDRFIKPHRILIVRGGGRIHAMSAVCTHKACLVKVKDNQIKCPCHGSEFSEHGTVIGGKAKSSLVRYGISTSGDGRIIVDKSKQFAEQKWDEPGSFIAVS